MLSIKDIGIWWNTEGVLGEVYIECDKLIEEFVGPDNLLVDFANEYIGGGAAEFGCVQEEI